jgi:L-ascorbate metabolism protein UlaG (beta-lactamase superfamily)
MEITWYGNARFRLRASGLTWWFDTAVQDIVEVADRATVVLSARSLAQLPAGSPAATIPVLDGPGEYELRGIPVFGVRIGPPGQDRLARQTAYVVVCDGLRICFIGPTTAMPRPADLGDMSPADIVLLPVGTGFGLTVADSQSVARTLEARIIIAYTADGSASGADVIRRLCRELESDAETVVRSVTMTGQTIPAVPRVLRLVSHEWLPDAVRSGNK